MNPMKNYIVHVKGRKEEVLRALNEMIKLVETHFKSNEHTISGNIWAWKEDKSGDIHADIKNL